MDTVGHRLQQLRKEHFKMNQSAFSKILGISQGALSEVERDNRGLPIEALCNLVKYSKKNIFFSCEWVLTGQGCMAGEQGPKDAWTLSDFQREAAAPLFPLLTEEQVALIDNYAKLNRRDQAEIRLLIQHKIAEYQNQEYEGPIQKGLLSHSPPLRGKQGGSQTA